jgi:hypothetical protein
MYKFCLFALLVIAAPALASANGGGNAKGVGSIQVTNNNGALVLLVAVDPSSSLLNATTLNEFTNRGGRVINPGGSTTFGNLKVGNHQVLTALVPAGFAGIPVPTFVIVNVTKNVTSKLTL